MNKLCQENNNASTSKAGSGHIYDKYASTLHMNSLKGGDCGSDDGGDDDEDVWYTNNTMNILTKQGSMSCVWPSL